MNKIDIYIDGSSRNPGPSGWAAVCVENGKKKVASDNIPYATNNQAELYAAIEGLKALKRPCEVKLFTDSNYLVTCFAHGNKWLVKEGRTNREQWVRFVSLMKNGGHKVSFVKVAGHKGLEMNELADKYAKAEYVKARHKLYAHG